MNDEQVEETINKIYALIKKCQDEEKINKFLKEFREVID